MRIFSCFSLLVIMLTSACNREVKVIYPLTPFINMKQFEMGKSINSVGEEIVLMNIKLDYIDGDSNFGGLTPYHGFENKNGVLILYKIENGKIHLIDTTVYNNPRFFYCPKVEDANMEYSNDSVSISPFSAYEGELNIQFEFPYPMVEYKEGDTALLEIQIIDRDLNFSNKLKIEQVILY